MKVYKWNSSFKFVFGGDGLNVRVETKGEFEYEAIDKLYGSVLKNFDFCKEGRYAFLSLDSVEDVEKLDSMLEEYIDNYDGDNPDINWYFGVMFKHDQGEFILEIKDNFD